MTPKTNLTSIIKDVSLTTNIPTNTVNHVLHFIFGNIRDAILSEKMESYMICNFGTFFVHIKSKPYYKIKLVGLRERRERKARERELKKINRDNTRLGQCNEESVRDSGPFNRADCPGKSIKVCQL